MTNRPFDIMVPYDEVLNSTQLVKACEVIISSHKLCVDLIILEMHDYDITFGMDWLSKHYAKIDSNKKEATFLLLQKESFTFKGGYKEKNACHLSLKSSWTIKGGCDEYLASVVIETEGQKPRLEEYLASVLRLSTH